MAQMFSDVIQSRGVLHEQLRVQTGALHGTAGLTVPTGFTGEEIFAEVSMVQLFNLLSIVLMKLYMKSVRLPLQ